MYLKGFYEGKMTKAEITDRRGPYRIWRYRRYNEYCTLEREWFEIDEWKRGWLFIRWHRWNYYFGGFKYSTQFEKIGDAFDAIDKHQNGAPRDETVSTLFGGIII